MARVMNSFMNWLSLSKIPCDDNFKKIQISKMVLFGITALYIVLIVATYFIFHDGPTEICARNMMSAQVVALLFQIVLNYVNYRSENKIVILTTLFVSTTIMLGALSAFFNLRVMCDFYGF